MLAELEALAGRIEEALALIDSVLADVVRTGVHVWDAEIYRLQGRILQCRPTIDLASAEAALDCFGNRSSTTNNLFSATRSSCPREVILDDW